MLKRIYEVGWMPVLLWSLFIGGLIQDDFAYFIGTNEARLLGALFVLTFFVVVSIQMSKNNSKYFIVVFTLFLSSLFLVLGYSSLPEQKIEIASKNDGHFKNFDYSSIKQDDMYAIRVDYVKREQKARKLELEAAELRYYGPKEYYSYGAWQYILCFSVSVFLGVYAICSYIFLSNINVKNSLEE